MAEADALVARVAAEHLGLATRRLLLEAGLSPSALAHQVRRGRLRAVHRGVYLAGHGEPTELQRMLAAVLACGPAAVLSHESAAAAWGLVAGVAGPHHVLHTGPRRRGRPGLELHWSRFLAPHEVTVHRGVPATTPVRTLLDLAATGSAARLELAVDEARARRLVTDAALARATGRGGARLRAVLADAPGFTRSEAERRLRALLRRAALPAPRTNVRVAGLEVDAYWPAERLAVEVDGYAAHAGRAAFERDRRRQQELVARGLRVSRVTWRQLVHEPEAVVARLAAALGAAA